MSLSIGSLELLSYLHCLVPHNCIEGKDNNVFIATSGVVGIVLINRYEYLMINLIT